MAHYFSEEPDAHSHPQTVTLTLPEGQFSFRTDRGMFSPQAIDAGTRVLLAEAPPPPQGAVNLVDIGCGYGPIAIALALRSPEATIWAVDVNRRALACCAENASNANVANRVRTITPDEIPNDLQVDGIWSNPPIRIGKTALHELLTFWLARLTSNANAHLVVHKHLGADSLSKWLEIQGYDTTRLTSYRGYRILEVTNAIPRES